MKVVQVIDQLHLGGAERVCVNLVNVLNRNQVSVKLIVLSDDGPLFDLVDDGVEVICLNKGNSKFKAYKQFVKHVKRDDIIHTHMRANYRFVRKAFLFFGGKKPIILHDHYGKIMVNQKVPKFFRFILKPQFYIGCSKLLTQWAVQKVKIDPSRVFLVNNFVVPHDPNSEGKHKKQGLVLVGSLKRVKNHKFAIDITKALDKELTIYCPALTSQKNYYKELMSYLEEIGFEEKVHFITGCTDVQAELKKYELALLTSTSEGDPLALIEYIAQGIPFLSSNVGEAVKIIKEYFPFLIQENFEVSQWVENYHRAITITPEEIEKIYNKHFSHQLYLKKYLDIYEQILNS
ncbi:glycosyltransferase [Aquimarina sp. U1-2]|uniref:glycosyltransferase n=1 Tax=Aquimarina sp. U1-2 TaxID=2823141 RepID=UPI001AECD3E1|nr:glycosyltransferase [Aquimarina sp. U1-2]MBP2830585.1 glycosyltransferase [Aquimarina sp. U1-2]